MTSLIYYYPIDLTGRNPTNLVGREAQLLVSQGGLSARVITLDHGGFYTRDLTIVDSTGKQLRPYIDYVATYSFADVSVRTGLEVCGAIVVLNPAFTGLLYITAQMVGGDLVFVLDAKQQVIQHLLAHPSDPITWGGIVGVPRQYLPGELQVELWEKVASTAVNIELAEMAAVVVGGDQNELMLYRAEVRSQYLAYLASFGTDVADHEAQHNNPHQVTAAQVGLGNVQNFPVSTEAQARAGTDTASYMTPLQTARAINTLATIPLTAHLNNRSNPHQVTAAQLNIPLKAAVDAIAVGKLALLGTAVDAATMIAVGGARYNYSQVYNTIRDSIPGGNFATDVFNPARLGNGAANAGTVLTNNGVWTSIQALVNQYTPAGGTSLYYVGFQGTDANALQNINNSFNNIQLYPVGTIVLYRADDLQWFWNGRKNYQNSINLQTLRGAVRTTGGWNNYGGPPAFGNLY